MKTFFVGRRGEVPLRLVQAASGLDALRQIKFEFNGTVHYNGARVPALLGSTLDDGALIAVQAVKVGNEWMERDEVNRWLRNEVS